MVSSPSPLHSPSAGRPRRSSRGSMRMRRPVAIGLARITAQLVGAAHHQGTALPGLLADRIWPEALVTLANQLGATVLVVGTNGKTTTAGLIAEILRSGAREPIANRSGANMRQGLMTSLVRESDLGGRLRPDPVGPPEAVFEVDEATLGQVLPGLGPCVIVATNLFRDQLDRYGEPDAIVDRWVTAMATAAEGSSFVYCADDPRLAMLASASRLPTRSFGLVAMPTDRDQRSSEVGAIADPVACRRCGRQLTYAWRSIGHLGAYSCPAGHIRRASRISRSNGSATSRSPDHGGRGPRGRPSGSVERSGAPSSDPDCPVSRMHTTSPRPWLRARDRPRRPLECRGDRRLPRCVREERMGVIDGRHVVLMLIKNTVSLAETVRLGASYAPDAVVLGLNDAAADGRDISWIWDAPSPSWSRGATSCSLAPGQRISVCASSTTRGRRSVLRSHSRCASRWLTRSMSPCREHLGMESWSSRRRTPLSWPCDRSPSDEGLRLLRRADGRAGP